MHYFHFVKVVKTSKQLPDDIFDYFLVKRFTRFDEIYYRSSLAELSNHKQTLSSLEYLVQLDYVRMVNFFKQIELCEQFLFFVA